MLYHLDRQKCFVIYEVTIDAMFLPKIFTLFCTAASSLPTPNYVGGASTLSSVLAPCMHRGQNIVCHA